MAFYVPDGLPTGIYLYIHKIHAVPCTGMLSAKCSFNERYGERKNCFGTTTETKNYLAFFYVETRGTQSIIALNRDAFILLPISICETCREHQPPRVYVDPGGAVPSCVFGFSELTRVEMVIESSHSTSSHLPSHRAINQPNKKKQYNIAPSDNRFLDAKDGQDDRKTNHFGGFLGRSFRSTPCSC